MQKTPATEKQSTPENQIPDAHAPQTVSVYCGSSYPRGDQADLYIAAIQDLGHALGGKKTLIRYGGGLYGHLQDLMNSAGAAGGQMEAILSSAYFKADEVYPPHVTVTQVDSDLDRAGLFLESDAYIVTPGGDGTFSESCFSHNRNLSLLFTQQTMKPLVFLNIAGFYEHVRGHFNHMAKTGYSSPARQAAVHFAPSVDAAIDLLWPSAPKV